MIIRKYEQENCPFHINTNEDVDLNERETKYLFQGSVDLIYSRYGCQNEDGDYFSARDTIHFEFSKYKRYDEQEMLNLVQEVLNHRMFN
jgi:aromatic ring hydroxylase